MNQRKGIKEATTKLKEKRLAAGLSQSQLAAKADVNYRALQGYEQGKKSFDNARIDTIFKIANALDCSLSDLIESEEFLEHINQYEHRIL